MGNTNETAAFKSIAMPFPPYNAKNPTLWFQQIESCFQCTGVTDELTRYHILVSRLEPDVAELIEHYLIKNDGSGNYKGLKTMIINNQKTKNELEKLQIGECTPSQFLRQIQEVARKNPSFPDSLVKSIWMSSVSPYVKEVSDLRYAQLRLADISYAKAQKKLRLGWLFGASQARM
ncbi:unnamed protein product [Callosobruchus maculatus]|uniref:DUF7041 domain-containing protein n=1 Tax=Callosobruchus maculatus TaxID=64391 RepID=A0A653CSW7_CALMS|nr:unnamed protein product [Callosobruchus maculatus]